MQNTKHVLIPTRQDRFMQTLKDGRAGKTFEQLAASLYTAEKLGKPKAASAKEEPKAEAKSTSELGALIV